MAKARSKKSFVRVFLNTVEGGRSVSDYRRNRKIFAQGDVADSVFYVQDGQVKLCVISELGKEAVVALHGKGDFFGEGCLSGQPSRLAAAIAMTDCVIMRQDRHRARAPRGTEVLRDVPVLHLGSERARRGGL